MLIPCLQIMISFVQLSLEFNYNSLVICAYILMLSIFPLEASEVKQRSVCSSPTPDVSSATSSVSSTRWVMSDGVVVIRLSSSHIW